MVISFELQERHNAQNFRIGEMQREKVREGRWEGRGKGGMDTEPKGKVGVQLELCTFDFVEVQLSTKAFL